MLLALVDHHADSLDTAVDELGRWIDHLRQVGIRGFLAEHTNDPDLLYPPGQRSADQLTPADTTDQTAPAATTDEAARDGTDTRTRGRRPRHKR